MLDRRTLLKAFISSALASALLPAVPMSALAADNIGMGAKKIRKPKRLRAGQTIGLIAPSSNTWEDQEIYFAMDIIRSFGFKVKMATHLFDRTAYLAGTDKDRANDVNSMFADDKVDAIFCLRGGYGSPRILPYLDYDLIRQHPKVFLGYSDVTALLNAIYTRSGVMTFHGPIAKQSFTEYTLGEFKNVLFNPVDSMPLATPPAFEPAEGQAEKENRLTTVTKGNASGVLVGGNLSLMVKLVGSPYEPDYTDKILFLEDVEEAPYRIDGMLTHLKLAGRLDKVAGIVFGKCTDCEPSSGPSFSVEHVLKDRLGDLKVPVLSGVMIGHIDDMATVPVGAMATLDASKQRLTLDEAAVL
ncbi:LD-carboxypeptidase [Paraglaciecola chathamensis]|uniref:LD-carboxypeptidase n=1 Tax=Paraglaciecola chathamensis TaxID=368405 RepID=A0ABS0WDB3_9ALTE|nr:LD-carboxypeptidase [Paraglaciecola chathamensis]MBJ2136465.1 LD-carboxypeptidase [Paraglaciecola chathamensis]